MRQPLLAVLLVAALLLTAGCTRKPAQPPAATPATTEPPAAGNGASPAPAPGVPAAVREYLQKGSKSPDAQWVAAMVPGEPGVAGVWVARLADLGTASRLAPGGTANALPVWTPGGSLLFPDADGNWQQAAPPEWKPQPFLPELLGGRRAIIRPGAFAPNGQQFVYSVPSGGGQETWLAGLDGKNIRSLGRNVMAGWQGSELVVTPEGK